MKTLLVVHAGLSHPSHTATVAQDIADAVVAQVSKRGEGLEVATISIAEYMQDIATYFTTGVPTPKLSEVQSRIADADAMIAATPVFTASYSGLFKMFFDTLDPKLIVGKPMIIAATAGTPRHSLVLEHAVRPLFAYLNAVVVPTGIFAATEDFGEENNLNARITRAATELAKQLVDTTGVVGFGPDFNDGAAVPEQAKPATNPFLKPSSSFADLLRGHDGGN